MIEVTNVNSINKGSLLATCDVYILPWDMEICDVKIFTKGTNRWIGMPSKKTLSDGVEKYSELIQFRKESTRNRFRNQIMTAIDKYIENNPNLEPQDLIKPTDEIPF